jgi:hypothetical protein
LGLSINRNSPLGALVDGLLQILEQLARDFGHVVTLNEVARLQEDFPQFRLSKRIIFCIENIEPLKSGISLENKTDNCAKVIIHDNRAY